MTQKAIVKIAYLECSAGISGDMCLGTLVDAGVPLRQISQALKALPVRGYRLEESRVIRAGIAAAKVDVVINRAGSKEHRTWKEVREIIGKSDLPARIKKKGTEIFLRLFKAEGSVHGRPFNRTHLHELAAVDCMVDVFGTLIGLELLGIEEVYASPVNLGSGSVKAEHGRLPVPAPATAEILRGAPVYASSVPFELTTPTGAAILREVAASFGPVPPMELSEIGYGAGQKDFAEFPNTLRLLVGRQTPAGPNDVVVIETNIDDMSPQIYEHVMDRLLGAGALDVSLTPVIMKKCRPGILLTVLCGEDLRQPLTEIIFRETTTIGLRYHTVSRTVLSREIRRITTPYGEVRVKTSQLGGSIVTASPEYEDCRKIARQKRIPLREVLRRATGS